MRFLWAGSALLLSGCLSVWAAHGPESVRPPDPANCTRDYVAPGFDLAVLAVDGLLVASAFPPFCNDGDECGYDRLAALILSVPVAIPSLISAVVGFSKVSDCREAYAA